MKKSGIELIAIERQEQIEKHGYNQNFVEENPDYYDTCQMAWMAELLLGETPTNVIKYNAYPSNWPKDEVERMLLKSRHE